MKTEYDIVIVGGGMVGASLALCLSRRLGTDIRILLVESFALSEQSGDLANHYSPSFDARSTALSYSSRMIYEKLEIWPELVPRLCDIESIHVSDRGHVGSAVLDASDSDWQALGHVIENAWLGQVLIQQVRAQQSIEVLSPATVSSVQPVSGGVNIEISNGAGALQEPQQLRAGLLVVADGANSGLRKKLGIEARITDYKQNALIANVVIEQGHNKRAFERFTDSGVMALLPLLDDADGRHRSALVWTLPVESAERLLACDSAEFVSALQRCFGFRLRAITHVGERYCYPLKLIEAEEQVRSNTVIMGNAAHSLHPVAGQGFNLALRDVAHLSACLGEAQEKGLAIGNLKVLLDYQARQATDQHLTIGFSDKIIRLFAYKNPVLSLARNVGLLAMDIVPELQKSFVHHAAGESGLGDWPNRSLRKEG